MKRSTKILFSIVGLAIVGGASIPFFVNADRFRLAIEKQVTTTLGRGVKLGDLSVSLFSGSLVAKDLSVADNPSFGAAPFLTAKELRIHVSLWSLIFLRKVNVRSFQIESPQITVIRAANGSWNFSSLGVGSAGATSGISKHSTPENFSVGDIVVEDGRVVIADLPARGQPRVYDHMKLTARGFSFTSQFPFEMSADLPGGGTISATGHVGPIDRVDAATSPADAQISAKRFDPIAAGFLDRNAGLSLLADIEMHAASDGQTLSTSGTARIQSPKFNKGAAVKPIELAYRGTLRLRENSGDIEGLTAKIGYATVHANGTYQLGELNAEDASLNFKIAGQNLPIDDLQPLMTAAAIRLPNGSMLMGGRLSMNVAVIGPAKSLVITGAIVLDNTHLVGFDISSHIHGIAALSRLKPGDTTDFEKLRANVRITDAGVVVDKIDAAIPAIGETTGNGRISPADQLDFDLVAKITSAKGIGKLGVGLLTKLNGSGGAAGSASGVPIRVTGTPDDPYITADIGSIVHKKVKSITSVVGN